uniref:NADH-ubiquinone oxidoreductase chain 4L n=1 Tax=Bourletiella arvalis TaxID=2049373 RepID=A0A384XET0_9HEXA|nr:NADH dehydrogenase subunit 4L [Bourletiella arvalis]ATP01408.1 NADH dehydrogenase subunit 4L [Bourletiella arvalis]
MLVPLSIYFSGLFIFSSKRKHLLLTLLSLEYMALGLFLFMFLDLMVSNYFFSLIYITFTACEGALGLSLLISMSRVYGSDYFSVFSMY